MISFILRNKRRETASVVMLVSFAGRQYRHGTGVGCPPAAWSAKKHRAKSMDGFDAALVNDTIDRYERLGYQAMRHFEEASLIPTKEQFADYLQELISPRRREYYLTDYIGNIYIPRYENIRQGHTITGFRSMLNKLREYEAEKRRKLTFSDIGMTFYTEFQRWFYGKGYSDNYFGSMIKFVKQCYTEARVVDGLHTENAIEHRDFITTKRTADAVYLTEDEIRRIFDLDLSPEAMRRYFPDAKENNIEERAKSYDLCRSLFLIGCYTGLRVSDFKRLKTAHVSENFIAIKTHKTGADIVTPIHPMIRALIDRGFDFSQTVTEQKINLHIKDICRLAGITQTVVVNKSEGGRMQEHYIEKYKLVTNHTARRSFATNAIKAGVSPLAVMKILGHKRESTTLRYIKISEAENAEQLLSHPFFNKSVDDTENR